MPLGLLLLFVLAVLVFFGFAHRVLDRMRLTDTQAMIILGLMIVGSFINIPLWQGSQLNVGGALIPFAIVVYLLVQAGTARERTRSVVALLVSGIAIVVVSTLFPAGPHAGQRVIIDPLWLSGITAGVIGYLAGRSRRASFIAGVGGVIAADIYHLIRAESPTLLGGVGVFDQVVIAGVIAVGLAEIVGETRERMQGGPDTERDVPKALRVDEGVHGSDGGGENNDE